MTIGGQRAEHVDHEHDEPVHRADLKRPDDGERESEHDSAQHDEDGEVDGDPDPVDDRRQVLRHDVEVEEVLRDAVHGDAPPPGVFSAR